MLIGLLRVGAPVSGGNLAREFNIYAPPQPTYERRTSMVVVTAVVGDGRLTEVDIIDRYIEDVDPDSDDTVRDIVLEQGQSYVLYLKEGDVNDSYGGELDGDYFRINGNHRIQTMIATASNWEFDYLPPYWHSNGTVDFFVFIPYGSDVTDWRLNVISYADGANVLVEDITVDRATGPGYTSVVPIGAGVERWSGVLNRGEDLLAVKGLNVLNYTHAGRTYHVHADDSVAVMVGSLNQANSGRDGGCYVMNCDGRNTGRELYMYLPDNYNHEKEIKVNTFSLSATINLYCWTGSQWQQLVSNVSLDAWNHYDYFGDDGIGYTQELFKLEASAPVAAFTGTWQESGSLGTADIASYVSSEYGYGAGHTYMVFIPPPAREVDRDLLSHLYITTIDDDATVNIIDTDHGGSVVNETITLNSNDVYDFQIDKEKWYKLAADDANPYVKVYSPKEIRVLTTNWNDNWMTYAAGIVVPQYSALYYENMPYERWVFLGFPLITPTNNPDELFGPYFGGGIWAEEPNIASNWRFSRWVIDYNTYVRWGETDYDGGYHGDPPLPQPGRGYWFYNSYSSAVDFYITGTEVDMDDAYYIPVDPPLDSSHPGLNQMANPFPIVIDWKDAQVEVTAEGNTTVMTILEASQAGIISQWAHRWNGYEYIPYNATNGGEFLVWDGFWVEQLADAKTEVQLKLPPIDVDLKKAVPVDHRNPFPNMLAETGEWYVSLSVTSDGDSIRDSYNGFGHKADALSGFDYNDARNITPNLNSFVDIYFPHNDADDTDNFWSDHPQKVCYDMRQEAYTTVWDFVVSSYNLVERPCVVSWNTAGVSADVELTLLDKQNGTQVNMKQNEEYAITTPAGNGFNLLNFQITAVRTDLFSDVDPVNAVPLDFSLNGNYPNPFNAGTMINYTLDKPRELTLKVYSLDGRPVKTLVNSYLPAGEYRVFWDGCDDNGCPVATGVYFYKLVSDHDNYTRKMLLIK